MTSLIRQYGPAKPYTKFVNIFSPGFDDSSNNGTSRLIPFTCYDGVIDINVSDSAVQNYIDNASGWNDYIGKKVKLMGGESLGQSLGSNMETWIRNLISNYFYGESTYTGPIKIKVQPVMTKVQATQGTWFVTPLPRSPVVQETYVNPATDNYIISGTEANNYYTSWVFKTPLTVQFDDNGTPCYITMYTTFS